MSARNSVPAPEGKDGGEEQPRGGSALSQPRQSRAQAVGLGGAGVVVGARFVDCFGLGAFGEGGVGKARGEAIAVLGGSGDGFFEAGAFGVEVDRALKSSDQCQCANSELH